MLAILKKEKSKIIIKIYDDNTLLLKKKGHLTEVIFSRHVWGRCNVPISE